MKQDSTLAGDLAVLDACWASFEIMAVSMLDMKVWQWMYEHPDCSAAELKEAVISLAKAVWNQYFAKAYGRSDETVLAIYSHMISYPLYLSAYAFGGLIEFQLGGFLEGKPFGSEVERIWSQGRLTPSAWMIRATGSDLSAQPLIQASEAALRRVR
jgi:oligoendopeptidase F